MSVRVMSLVWSLDLPDSQEIVLLALADSANDEGHCWPSMASLSRKCSKGERTVQGVIKQLVDAGHLTRREVPGKGCNYTVHPRSDCTPAAASPPQGTANTPAAAADKPSRTITNGLSNDKPKRAQKAVKPFRMPADWVPGPLPPKIAALVALWPPGRFEREAENVRDYWLDRTERRPGWDRTFHNRIRDIHDRVLKDCQHGRSQTIRAANPPPSSQRDGFSRTLDQAIHDERTGGFTGASRQSDDEGAAQLLSFAPAARAAGNCW